MAAGGAGAAFPEPTVARFVPAPLAVPPRLLLGPGPSNADPRVHAAMAIPQVGHLDPAFLTLMEELKKTLRYVWQTENELTIPMSGTGSAAMEACFANLIRAGDKVLVFVNGYFGMRMMDMASRYGAEVVSVERTWGEVFTVAEVAAAVREHRPALVGIVHAETSTGACQPLEGAADAVREVDALLVVDSVTSIGGLPILVDAWGIDACYAGGQKCLGCPPGASPLTFGPRAVAKLDARVAEGDVVKNWYLDLSAIRKYLAMPEGAPRSYHHTAPISSMYALREGLRCIAEEGLPAVWRRHRDTAEYFWAGLEDMGLELVVAKEHRLPSLTTIRIPDGVDGAAVIKHLREKLNIEIGGGLGIFAGKAWRVGLMGFNSRRENALTCLAALREALTAQGWSKK
mmetsp:Transcript_27120/g.94079  ORF Transcript_27120/g.94079 Transcript_27120/m.94079 type:complete len:401 (-) Transcript_27120:104-1306(-)|eukprot:CAMPEP_0203828298 /NCGR_PEP_ID=MMETSP0115-20131106/60927_1 /ASSEMBLY_ACC=CAM_ASM_000227 /TAXON_ID=33651 /ORGANISM="Bicosoecid sp, Strain ms1" /LENGTH=400 /DNA_ID=CAMNT_0050737357 /DNA_START=84 /DNA_END=1286 /DNA_ORIENTATION=-